MEKHNKETQFIPITEDFIVELLVKMVRAHPTPASGARCLYGILANAVGLVADADWKALVTSVEPCDNEGCDCHILGGNLMEALDAIRTDRRTELDKRKAGASIQEDIIRAGDPDQGS